MGDSVGPLEAAQRRCHPVAEPWAYPGECRVCNPVAAAFSILAIHDACGACHRWPIISWQLRNVLQMSL